MSLVDRERQTDTIENITFAILLVEFNAVENNL